VRRISPGEASFDEARIPSSYSYAYAVVVHPGRDHPWILSRAPTAAGPHLRGPGVRPLVLDTSVALAWNLPEAFAPAARSCQKQLLDGRVRFVVPSLHFWEMANVLRTCVRRRELAPSLELDATACEAVFITLARTLDAPLLTAERKTRPWIVRLGKLVETLAR
jgi:predicted nucleic acid-binding protein